MPAPGMPIPAPGMVPPGPQGIQRFGPGYGQGMVQGPGAQGAAGLIEQAEKRIAMIEGQLRELKENLEAIKKLQAMPHPGGMPGYMNLPGPGAMPGQPMNPWILNEGNRGWQMAKPPMPGMPSDPKAQGYVRREREEREEGERGEGAHEGLRIMVNGKEIQLPGSGEFKMGPGGEFKLGAPGQPMNPWQRAKPPVVNDPKAQRHEREEREEGEEGERGEGEHEGVMQFKLGGGQFQVQSGGMMSGKGVVIGESKAPVRTLVPAPAAPMMSRIAASSARVGPASGERMHIAIGPSGVSVHVERDGNSVDMSFESIEQMKEKAPAAYRMLMALLGR